MPDRFLPRVTVATVVYRDDRFLMVEELIGGELKYNQPAGHLEKGESLIDAAVREVKEETAWSISMDGYLGVSIFDAANGDTFVRHAFAGTAREFDPEQPLDSGIQRALWLTRSEIEALGSKLRSPLILPSIDQFLQGELYPLAMLSYQR